MTSQGAARKWPPLKSSDNISAENVSKLQNVGYRILLLGTNVNSFVKTFSAQHVFVYSTLIGFQGLYATYELLVTFFFSRNMLEMVSHSYIAIYLYNFHAQWMYLVIKAKTHLKNEIHLEEFRCTKAIPEVAERLWRRNIVGATTALSLIWCWWTFNTMGNIVSPVFELIITYVRTNEFITVFIFPPVFQLPWWAQILTFIANCFTMLGLLVFCSGSYIVMGIRVLKIKTLCEILNEALKRNDGEETDFKHFIEDHVRIIRFAKVMNRELAIINNCMFFDVYLEFAIQLFSLSVATPDGAHYYVIATDLLSIFFILSLQCWMGSTITHSLQSIADGAYSSEWYKKGRRHALDVGFMIQMAQKPYVEKIWMGSLNVERSTILSLVRSSYAAYTLLMILQQDKTEDQAIALAD